MKILNMILWMGILWACDSTANFERTVIQETQAEEQAKNIVMEYLDSARLKVRLTAPSMIRKEGAGSNANIFEDGIQVTFFDPTHRNRSRDLKESWLTAQWAEQDIQSKRFVVRDQVTLYNIYGDTLMTTELIWDEKISEVYTNKFVKIKRPENEVIYSHGFRANQNFTIFEVNAVEGNWKIQDLTIK